MLDRGLGWRWDQSTLRTYTAPRQYLIHFLQAQIVSGEDLRCPYARRRPQLGVAVETVFLLVQLIQYQKWLDASHLYCSAIDPYSPSQIKQAEHCRAESPFAGPQEVLLHTFVGQRAIKKLKRSLVISHICCATSVSHKFFPVARKCGTIGRPTS